jgi:glycosyltransferase involved in cell wall biosynthesis
VAPHARRSAAHATATKRADRHPSAIDATVVIPARDAAGHLDAALAALRAQATSRSFEVLVVDDGSRDETPVVAAAAAPLVRLLSGRGEGPAAARNLGAREARGRVLAFTDADCAPAPGWLDAGLAAVDAGAQLVQGRVDPPPGVERGPWDRFISVEREYGLYETANLFVTRALFEALGGFQSVLEPRAGKELGEDVWLGWRARRAGARTAFAPEALVHHAVFPRGPRGYIEERLRLRFFPELVRRIPELREHFLYRRCFLTARTARFDLAVVGVLLARRRHVALLATLPYAVIAVRRALPQGRRRLPAALATEAIADATGAAALAVGSLRSRALVL